MIIDNPPSSLYEKLLFHKIETQCNSQIVLQMVHPEYLKIRRQMGHKKLICNYIQDNQLQ